MSSAQLASGHAPTDRSRFVYATTSHSPDLMTAGGTTYRYITDPRGSVRLIIDTSTGTVAQRLDYSPYGRVLQRQAARMQPFGFAGGLWDTDTRLVRFGRRDYEPTSGRWVKREFLPYRSFVPNHFRYVGSNPVNEIDPTGNLAPLPVVAPPVCGWLASKSAAVLAGIAITGSTVASSAGYNPSPAPGPGDSPGEDCEDCGDEDDDEDGGDEDDDDDDNCTEHLKKCLTTPLAYNSTSFHRGYDACRQCKEYCDVHGYWPLTLSTNGQNCNYAKYR